VAPAAPDAAAVSVASVAPAAAAGDSAWVIDGRPDFHRRECARLREGEPEEIPRGQAKEDGFQPCSECDPEAVPAADSSAPPVEAAPAAAPAATGDPQRLVWVVDGRPDYHLQSCSRLDGTEPEQIPWAQANADGF